jgi:aprataxin
MAMRLAPERYEPRLKDTLVCFHCGETAKNMPALKKHLQDEFDALRKREVGKLKRKREAECAVSGGGNKEPIGKSTRM